MHQLFCLCTEKPAAVFGRAPAPRFLRVAPLSASVVGTSFAVHGLWAAQWFRDVDRFAPDDVLDGLPAMGAGLTLGSLAIGAAAVYLENLRVSCTKALGWFCAGFLALQVAVQLKLPISQYVLWGAVGAFGCMGVLSYSILDRMFPAALVGRANSALNVLHLTAAWAVQASIGAVIARWAVDPHGHYPVVASSLRHTACRTNCGVDLVRAGPTVGARGTAIAVAGTTGRSGVTYVRRT